jgi:hypothetical protein
MEGWRVTPKKAPASEGLLVCETPVAAFVAGKDPIADAVSFSVN